MTRKVKALLAVIMIVSILGMGYTFQDSAQAHRLISLIKQSGVSADEEQNIRDLAAPHYIITGDGTYEYRITDKYAALPEGVRMDETSDAAVYDSFLKGIANVMAAGVEPELIEDAEKDVSEAVSRKSMTAIFDYEVSAGEFFAFNGIKSSISTDADRIDRIILTEDGTILLCRNSAGTYYRLDSGIDSGMKKKLAEFMDYAFSQCSASTSKVQSITGLTGVYNNTMVPIASVISVDTSAYVSELNKDRPEDQEAIKAQFFSDGLDFVKEMTDADNSLVMMYGIGEKVLKMSPAGELLYTEELDEAHYHSCGYYKSLGYARDYIEQHSGTGDLSGLELYVEDAEPISKGECTGYRITFGAVFSGLDIMYQKKVLMSVDVMGSQITRYYRNLPDVRNIGAAAEGIAVIDVMELVRANCDLVSAIMLENYADSSAINTEKYTANDNYYAVTTSITDAHLSMVRLDAGSVDKTNDKDAAETADPDAAQSTTDGNEAAAAASQQLIPAWYVQIDGVDFWFTADGGKLLSYSLK